MVPDVICKIIRRSGSYHGLCYTGSLLYLKTGGKARVLFGALSESYELTEFHSVWLSSLKIVERGKSILFV